MKRLSLLLLSLILLLSLGACCTPSLASTPLDVYESVHVGMTSEDVYFAIDKDYANEACYLIKCEYITPGFTSHTPYTPTLDWETDYYMWVFMPRFSQAQATAVGFHHPFTPTGTTEDTVIAVERMDYEEAQLLVAFYGSRTFW